MRILAIVCALALAAILGVALLTKRHVETADERQIACDRIPGGVLVRQERGGAVCVQRAVPPSAKGSKLT
jgi:hypothetical protein